MNLSPAARALFRPLSREVRATASERYFAYLTAREGRLDAVNRKLARREALFTLLITDPVRPSSPVDAAAFHRNHNAARPEPGLSRELLWLVAVAKANRTECFGMEQHIAVNGILDGEEADTQAYVDMQEVYHTRILLDVLRCFDLDVQVAPPALPARLAVHAMVRLPQRLGMPMILASEVVAATVFRLLLDTGRELFGKDEALWARLSALLEQILIDEAGHVTYCRARLGRAGLTAARWMLPAVTASLLVDLPEIVALVGAKRVRQAVGDADLVRITEGCAESAFLLA